MKKKKDQDKKCCCVKEECNNYNGVYVNSVWHGSLFILYVVQHFFGTLRVLEVNDTVYFMNAACYHLLMTHILTCAHVW